MKLSKQSREQLEAVRAAREASRAASWVGRQKPERATRMLGPRTKTSVPPIIANS